MQHNYSPILYFIVTDSTLGKLPNTPCFNILILSWMIYGLHINIAFQGKLVSILTTPIYEPLITTDLEMFDSADINVFISQGLITRYPDYIKDKKYTLLTRNYTAKARDATISNLASALHKRLNYTDRETRISSMAILKKPLLTSLNAILIRKGHPIKAVFNKWMLRIHAAGISEKYWKDAMKEFEIVPRSKELHIQLKFDHLEIAFLLLFYGSALSFILFLFEIVLRKIIIK